MSYRKVFLIGNPIAGGGALRKIKKAEEILKNKGISVETLLTEKPGDAQRFAEQIKNSRETLVIAAGGDGTYNEVVNGLAFSETPMAILPMGTTSVLAKELKIPKNLKKAIEVAITGNVQKIHLGRIKNQEKQRLFILMAGVGFDGKAVYNVDSGKKRHLKKIAYILSGIKTLISYSPDELKILNSGTKKAYSAVISKASCYGGSFKIAPDSDLKKPYFYAFLSKTRSKFEMSLQILGVIIGKHIEMKKTEYFKTESLKILGNAHVQIDGDYFGKTPVEIDIVRDSLNLVFPE
ncbi:lipid kinase, YegS/Rv2252/BmrU family [Thermodesulfovibrio aggregans]|uniref:Lipid kinase, YegS/Rv2252/BmrU family n=1 Tax=Thermodesulfovibrio aggregans TaxID=86166 RepID=A0A0U9HLW3_9BACT|nr:diacylglycerol kinase family protein [Thermodesulfovibrio aggregans]GAQ94080.1 lipid kinase, YegS/Rv2252/BmrU family [Thermodesulfovibrio aggregans]